jgi:3-oxoacyl-[acyl-carrier protein] reductase
MGNALEGRRALVTGAASGIGLATVEALRSAGAAVVGLDVAKRPGDASFVRADVASEGEVAIAVAEARRLLGGFDILVNSAGISTKARLAEFDLADYHRIFSINVLGTILVTRAVLPDLGEGARIINVASELARLGRAGAALYTASKGAIVSLTRSWARELAPKILVNAIAPGPTDTPLLNFANRPPAQQAEELANPLGRIGRPEEIAAAIVFLAGPGATFVTGQCLGVDGGATMR